MSSELMTLEEQGWRALSAGGTAAREFYRQVLDDKAVFILPGGMALDGREAIIQSMSGPPWSAYDLQDISVLKPTASIGIVIYGAIASRGDGPAYSALISSTYVHRADGWRLALHQQTPR